MRAFNKLVRDNIPAIIAASGRSYEVRQLSSNEYELALRTKISEEALEIQHATPEELLAELADLQEVIDALRSHLGYTKEELEDLQTQKRKERGGFTTRTMLVWTE